jgi:hypothetical protein
LGLEEWVNFPFAITKSISAELGRAAEWIKARDKPVIEEQDVLVDEFYSSYSVPMGPVSSMMTQSK